MSAVDDKYQLLQMDPRDALYFTRIVLYTEVDVQCDKLTNVLGRTSAAATIVNLVRPNLSDCQNLFALTPFAVLEVR